MPQAAAVHRTQVSGSTWAYRTWGEGSPVLCLHGLADHGLVWRSLAESPGSQGFQWIAPDLPGHGDSDKPSVETAYGAPHLAQQLETFAQDQGWQDVMVVAHSWAAKVALLWAQQQPQRIQKLVLIDPFFVNRFPTWTRITFPLLYRTLPFLKVMGPFPTRETAIALAQTLKQYRGWSPLQQDVFAQGVTQQPNGQWVSKFTPEARDGVFKDTVQTAGLTQTLFVHTLLILPEQGLNRFSWQLSPYEQYLPFLLPMTVPGNHWPHLVEPEALAAAIAPFLSTRLPPTQRL
jgi:pimeloyl-ACP methyl ester carboxylesterase